MKILKNSAWLILALAMGMSACEKDDTTSPNPPSEDPLKDYTLIGEQNFHHDGLTAKLYMMEDPFVGYNRVAVQILETGTDRVQGENVDITFRPMMDMGMMMHTTPVENPSYNAEMDAHMGSATFIMPSTAGNWSFEVIGGPDGATPDTARFDITVMAKDEARLYSFVSAADSVSSYFVALKEPMAPEMGLNDFQLMIYKRESMMSFPPATDLKVEIEPEMPSMGHGSPNNENPIHVEDGLYSGKVNFTMTGYWKVNVKIMNGNDAVLDDDGSFDITF